MRVYVLLALLGMAVAAGKIKARQTTSWNTSSIFAVLATALPSSLIAEATNTVELSSDLAAQFATATPAWYSSLPADVKSWIILQGENGTVATASAAPSAGKGTTMRSSTSSARATLIGTSSSESVTGSSTETTSDSSSSSATVGSIGGAALPSGVLGAGVAAIAGFVGILVL